jgi:hypothetical protein
MSLFGLWVGAALAATSSDAMFGPEHFLVDRAHRSHATGWIYGARNSSALTLARRWADAGEQGASTASSLAVELDQGDKPSVAIRPHWRAAAGTWTPIRQNGDPESGLWSGRLGLDARGYWGPLEAMLGPELQLDSGPGTDVGVALPLAWLGVNTESWRIGFGVEERWIGPGRHGGIMLTNHARPAPLGSVAWAPTLGNLGHLRMEAGVGWLDAPRTDVERPGWLLMDFRWAPLPAVEIGATRMSIFGGVGRPPPSLGQLILPTKPHVSNDPEQKLPDQDEIAALDLRVTLPIHRVWPGLLDYAEFWTQYGGEDVIARSIGPVPVPSLAGIANLWGGEVGRGSWTANIEWARLLDDTFRWYTGHRIYHQGFTQSGDSMGHPRGGDSRSFDGAIRWMDDNRGIELNAADVIRVGAIDVAQGRLRTLMSNEHTRSAGLKAWFFQDQQWWHSGLTVAKTSGSGFHSSPEAWSWHVFIGR